MIDSGAEQVLRQGIAALPFVITEQQVGQFFTYLTLLNRWNTVHNLTAVREPRAQAIIHVLDCLAVLPYIPEQGVIADIGSGAGLPALIIAIMRPELHVVAVESNRKKAAFIRQTTVELHLNNVSVVSERVEQWKPKQVPTVIISRAMAAPHLLVGLTEHLGDRQTAWMMMCGHEPEIVPLEGFTLRQVVSIAVPLLDATRTLLVMAKE